MSIITKKNIKTFKLYKDTQQFKQLLNENNLILFFYFQFFNQNEQLLLNKLLKKYNLSSKLITKKNAKYILKSTKYTNLHNICKNNILLIYSNINNEDNKYSEAIKILINNKKLKLVATKLDNNLYKISDIIKYISLDKTVQFTPLLVIIDLLTKLKISISTIKI